MAAVTSSVQTVYSTDQDLVELLSYSPGKICLPGTAPSDRLKIGFFKTDHATQTDVSDILELKELSTAVESLVKEMTGLKKSVESNTLSLEARYAMKLEDQCSDLYKRMNDDNSYLKKMYLKRIEVLRHSFRQQLRNAIAKIRADYKKYCAEIHAQNQISLDDTCNTLRMLKEKDLIISSLKERLAQYEVTAEINPINFDSKDDFDKDQLVEENEELKEQIIFLEQNTEKMSETIILKDIRIKELDEELIILNEKNASTIRKMQKLFFAEENLKKQLEFEKDKGKHMLEVQKLKMDSLLSATLQKMEEKEHSSQELIHSLKKNENQLLKQIGLSSNKLEVLPAKEEVCPVQVSLQKEIEPVDRNQAIEELKKLKLIDKHQRELIESLNKRLDRTNRMWEKKFAVLRQSCHALKDEMYLRCSLQHQAPTLHCAFTRYTLRQSVGIDCQAKHHISPYFPLPQIGSHSAPQTSRTEHNMDRAPSASGAVNLRSPDNI
uniref:uncharacterized protein C10orf67 homolog, mitochondrial isoform X2 n=1 Tax=Pristiophorus japonicus TaxID=55135 RepID=UPI00398ED8A0